MSELQFPFAEPKDSAASHSVVKAFQSVFYVDVCGRDA